MGTQKQADAIAECQLMAMFGETIESEKEWMKKVGKRKSSVESPSRLIPAQMQASNTYDDIINEK